jgi:nuclear RNA export factor
MDKENRVDTKSFDRSFILGPGGGVGGIRVISDALVVRDFYPTNTVLQKANLAPSGATAATVQPPQPQLQLAPPAPAPSPIPPHPEIPAGSDFGQASPGKTDEQLLKEKMKLELSFATRMKLAYAEDALANSNWDYPVALGKFNEMNGQGNIPMDVFLNV